MAFPIILFRFANSIVHICILSLKSRVQEINPPKYNEADPRSLSSIVNFDHAGGVDPGLHYESRCRPRSRSLRNAAVKNRSVGDAVP